MRMVGQGTAADAYCVYLLDVFRNCHEAGHGAERFSQVVRIQAGDDHADALVGQGLADLDDAVVEELGFVDANHLDIVLYLEHAGRALDGGAGNAVGVVRDHVQV